jgi:hypothetical protein
LIQKVRLTGDLSRFRRRDYVYATQWPSGSPFAGRYARVRNDPAWNLHVLDARHNLMRDAPEDLLRILLESQQASRTSSA